MSTKRVHFSDGRVVHFRELKRFKEQLSTKAQLHAALVAIKRVRKIKTMGICGNISVLMSESCAQYPERMAVLRLLDKYLDLWPGKEANAEPHVSPIANYWEESSSGRLWVNDKRHALLDWLIEATHHDSEINPS